MIASYNISKDQFEGLSKQQQESYIYYLQALNVATGEKLGIAAAAKKIAELKANSKEEKEHFISEYLNSYPVYHILQEDIQGYVIRLNKLANSARKAVKK